MIRGSGISCRSWLQYLLSFVAPVSCICCRSWLQYWFCHFVLWLQYHLLSPVSDVRGSSICRSWLRSPVSVDRGLWLQWWLLLLLLWFQYLLCVSPVPLAVACGSIGCRFWLQSPVSVVAPVSVVRNSSLQYLSVVWLRYLQYLSSRLVAPVSVVHGSTTSICCLWLQWLSFMAPVFSVCCCSGICRSWLRYLLLSRPVAPVAPAMAQVLSIVTSCGSKLSLVAPVAVVVACPVAPLTGNHLVYWQFFCKIAIYCCISPNIDR